MQPKYRAGDYGSYYEKCSVRERIGEYFGGLLPEEATAVYFTKGTESSSQMTERLPLEELQCWMRRGAELNRSLWDRKALLAHLDMEYVNFDAPLRAYLEPERTFALQRPIARAVKTYLSSFGIKPMHLITGRGHHYIWSVDFESSAFERLAALGHLSASLARLYATKRSPTGELVSPSLGLAYAGLGLLMEFLAGRIKSQIAAACEVPVEIGAIEVGGCSHEREMVSLDITEYGDPLCSRTMRAPFSAYLKINQHHDSMVDEVFRRFPEWFVLPLADMTEEEALEMRHDRDAVIRLAERIDAVIPDGSAGTGKLISQYYASALAQFHEQYYAEQHDAPGVWPETYDRTPLDRLPACARFILEQPNDLLLRPGCVQRVVRVLLALGWHPRHVAGLIRSKYERDYGWNTQWAECDPATRADFYARIFSGLFYTGIDDLVDFNCQSAREEGLCFVEHCPGNLQTLRSELLERRNHERLARRAVDRMLLQNEHP